MRPLQLIRVAALAGCAFAGSATASLAQNALLERIDTMTPEQLNGTDVMEVYEAYKEAEGQFQGDPVAYAGSRIRHALAALYYPVDLQSQGDPRTDPALSRQVSAFQSTLDAPPDGTLNYSEFNRLIELEAMAALTPVRLMWRRAPRVTENWAGAAGTWVIQGERIAYPLNFNEINCHRVEGYCEATEVTIDAAGVLGSGSYLVGGASTVTYTITSWTDGVVEARSRSQAGECRAATLTLNQATGVVSEVAQDLGQSCQPTLLPRLGAPRVATLADPDVVAREYFAGIFGEVERHHGPLAEQSYRRPLFARAP